NILAGLSRVDAHDPLVKSPPFMPDQALRAQALEQVARRGLMNRQPASQVPYAQAGLDADFPQRPELSAGNSAARLHVLEMMPRSADDSAEIHQNVQHVPRMLFPLPLQARCLRHERRLPQYPGALAFAPKYYLPRIEKPKLVTLTFQSASQR